MEAAEGRLHYVGWCICLCKCMCFILICVGMLHIFLNIFDIFMYMFDMLIDISICLLICIYIYIYIWHAYISKTAGATIRHCATLCNFPWFLMPLQIRNAMVLASQNLERKEASSKWHQEQVPIVTCVAEFLLHLWLLKRSWEQQKKKPPKLEDH